MAKEKITLGNRKAPPLGGSIGMVVLYSILFALSLLCSIILWGDEDLFFLIVLMVLCAVMIVFYSVIISVRAKSGENKSPLAIFNEKDEEIEFYSVLSTSLKIKKDKIYMIKTNRSGQFQVFFYSEINQKLVYNCGFFVDAKECKEEIKKYLTQKIK